MNSDKAHDALLFLEWMESQGIVFARNSSTEEHLLPLNTPLRIIVARYYQVPLEKFLA